MGKCKKCNIGIWLLIGGGGGGGGVFMGQTKLDFLDKDKN